MSKRLKNFWRRVSKFSKRVRRGYRRWDPVCGMEATGYNVVALSLVAGVLAAQGILLQPAVAALFMSLSTIIVAFNALLLKRREL